MGWSSKRRASGPGSGKHMRFAYCPLDNFIYVNGGDYGGAAYVDSGRQEMWYLDPHSGQYSLIQPYCRPDGGPQPTHPDECGWAWDSRRSVFWHGPGFQWSALDCPGSIHGRIMSFDVIQGRWNSPYLPNHPRITGGGITWTDYDHDSDSLIAFYYDGGWGSTASHLNIESGTWTHTSLKGAASQVRFFDTLKAHDKRARAIYMMGHGDSRLWRYDIPTRTITQLASCPVGAGVEKMPMWGNGVLYYPARGGSDFIHLYTYHPDLNEWEDNGEAGFSSRHAVYYPPTDTLIMHGNNSGHTWFYKGGSPMPLWRITSSWAEDPQNPIQVPTTTKIARVTRESDGQVVAEQTVPSGTSTVMDVNLEDSTQYVHSVGYSDGANGLVNAIHQQFATTGPILTVPTHTGFTQFIYQRV